MRVFPLALLALLGLSGCTALEAHWSPFWGFLLLVLAWGAFDLWARLRR